MFAPMVLYRKWRPGRFGEVVGQDPIVQTLRQALERERIAHAYLFCGPRGTGKTTTARLLAKAANCYGPRSGESCDVCLPCQAAIQGRALDLIEIDAASHRGIDDIRSLREKVQYVPSESRYKVYIIDEVHMLTEAAFNALLKTLEEPPPSAIFILATTEPQKVPPTIISRCQRFDFRRLTVDTIVSRLEELCAEEKFEVKQEALRVLARQSVGSLRDAINLVDQLTTSYGGSPTLENVYDLLGLGQEAQALDLTKSILAGRTREGLLLIEKVISQGGDLHALHLATVDYLRSALLLKSGAVEAVDQTEEVKEDLRKAVSTVGFSDLIRAIHLFAVAPLRTDSPTPLSLELALVQATSDSDSRGRSTDELPNEQPEKASELPLVEATSTLYSSLGKTELGYQQPESSRSADLNPETIPTPSDSTDSVSTQWGNIIRALSKKKGVHYYIGALMRDSRSRRIEGDTIVLGFSSKSNMERLQEELQSPQGRQAVNETLNHFLGISFKVRVELDEERNPETATGPGGHLIREILRLGAHTIEEEPTI